MPIRQDERTHFRKTRLFMYILVELKSFPHSFPKNSNEAIGELGMIVEPLSVKLEYIRHKLELESFPSGRRISISV